MLRNIFLFILVVECGRSVDHAGFKRELSFKTWRRANSDALENWFNVYDPSFLSVVWPKIRNGVHLMLDRSCWDDVSLLFKDLADGRAWAYDVQELIGDGTDGDVVDASGRYPSGVLAGRRHWLGSHERCHQLDREFIENGDNDTLYALRHNDYMNTVLRKERYDGSDPEEGRWLMRRDELMSRLVAAEHWPPCRLAYTALGVRLNLTKITMLKSYDIVLGVCLPKSCSSDDVESLINFSITLNDLRNNKSIPRVTKITSVRQIEEYYDIAEDTGAIILILITLLLIILAITATVVDFDLLKCVPYNKKSMSFDLPKYNNHETKLIDEIKRRHIDVKSIDSMLAKNANMNLITMKKLVKSNDGPSAITLDVVNVERVSGSCNRCGKYKRQCPNNKQTANLPACPRVKYSSFASLSTEDKRKTFLCNLLLCCSLNITWNRIFNKNTANKDLSLIHVMKILATFWIIFVHIAVMTSYTSDDAGDFNERENVYYIIATGTIAFDTLFFVSGLFSSHHFFYLKSRYSVKELVSFGGACGQIMQFVCFVTNRIIRLLPSYAYTILLSAVVARSSRATAPAALADGDHDTCSQYWWRNVLYISNAYPKNEQCMQISWYLSTESQLHALGALACAAGGGGGGGARAAALLAAAGALAAAAGDVGAAYLQPDTRYSNAYDVYGHIIERPWARVAPYFIGVFAGWLIHTMQGKLKLTKVTSCVLWAASTALAVAAGALPAARPAWPAAGMHAAWPAALLWPALVATTHFSGLSRRLGGGALAGLSRLSYGALLLHAPAARLLLPASPHLWVFFAGTLVATVPAALLLALLLEMPCCGLLRRLSDSATT